MNAQSKDFILGESALPVPGVATPEERKSPPLGIVSPEHKEHYQIDTRIYLDPEELKREWPAIWKKVWINAGRVSDLPEIGSWFRFEIGDYSIIITRSENDRISAFFNTCQHRGAQLVRTEFGRNKTFVCPYHSWNFDRDGRCKSITDRDLFREEALKGSLDIPQVRCETYGGFVFINFDKDAAPLLEFLDDIPELLKGFHIEDMIVRNDVLVDLECNWKTIQDSFSENYHVHAAHPAAAPAVNEREVQMDFYPHGHSRRITPIGVNNPRKGKPGPIGPLQAAMLQAVGIDPDTYEGNTDTVRRDIQLAKRAMTGRAAEIYADLSDGQLSDDWAMNIFPNMHWSTHAEGVLVLEYLPHATDPNRCKLHIMVLGHRGVPFESYMPAANDKIEEVRPPRLYAKHDDPDIIDKVSLLMWEDISMTRGVQKSMASGALTKVKLSEHEQVIRHQQTTRQRYLAAHHNQS